jgi:hypothetical protein
MSDAFEKHIHIGINEMHARIHIYKTKKIEEMKTFRQRVEKAWKNINEKKLN